MWFKCGCETGQGGWLTEYGEQASIGMSACYSPEGEQKMEVFGKNKQQATWNLVLACPITSCET